MLPAAALTMLMMAVRFHIERICRAVAPPLMPAMMTTMVAVPMATRPMVVEAVPAEFMEDPVEDSRRQSVEDNLPLVALIVAPAVLMLAFTTERRLNADGEHCHC